MATRKTVTTTTSKLLASQVGRLGILQLNHPKAYHALTMDMIYAAHQVLKHWWYPTTSTNHNNDEEDAVQAILWHSSSDAKRASFCSGGDVKSIALECLKYSSSSKSPPVLGQGMPGLLSADFFRHEYYLNHALSLRHKIQISIWDGLVFGGGVGISIFGKYRIATEKTLFAMPETAIGFFPDVGALWAMSNILASHHNNNNRLSNNNKNNNNNNNTQNPHKGTLAYLALTGQRLQADDLLFSGLATHFVPTQDIPTLIDALIQAAAATTNTPPNQDHDDFVAPILQSFHKQPFHYSSFLEQNQPHIDRIFDFSFPDNTTTNNNKNKKTIQDILEELQSLDSEFAKTTRATLQKMSPTSLAVTWELLRRGDTANISLADHLQMEFRLAQHLMKSPSDFQEGIRATLLDKDDKKKPPLWKPLAPHEDIVQFYFEQPILQEWNVGESPLAARL